MMILLIEKQRGRGWENIAQHPLFQCKITHSGQKELGLFILDMKVGSSMANSPIPALFLGLSWPSVFL
jgi:hypothetical protein